MPEATSVSPTPEERRLDRHLMLGILLPLAAAGCSIVVGFIVAHWITITASKRTGYAVSVAALALCAGATVLTTGARNRLGQADDTLPQQGRRIFMAKLGLLLSAMAAIVIVASTLVLVTLGPSD